MKLNIYILKLVRSIEKEIGKKETVNLLGLRRETIFRWKKNYWELSVDNLQHVCEKYCEIYTDEDFKEIFMGGLVALCEDTITKIKNKKEKQH